jgi:hypothetical protein
MQLGRLSHASAKNKKAVSSREGVDKEFINKGISK